VLVVPWSAPNVYSTRWLVAKTTLPYFEARSLRPGVPSPPGAAGDSTAALAAVDEAGGVVPAVLFVLDPHPATAIAAPMLANAYNRPCIWTLPSLDGARASARLCRDLTACLGEARGELVAGR
jgi:hypothetical protein